MKKFSKPLINVVENDLLGGITFIARVHYGKYFGKIIWKFTIKDDTNNDVVNLHSDYCFTD